MPSDKHIRAAAEKAGYGGTIHAVKAGVKYADNTLERSIMAHATTLEEMEAELAAKDAEIARLREALTHIESLCPNETGSMTSGALAGLLFNIDCAAGQALTTGDTP